MFNKKAIFSLILLGIFSFSLLVYYYFAERSFVQKQREFLMHSRGLDNANSDLTSELLKNSLFAYNSQDEIAHDYEKMQKELQQLQNTKILNNKSYANIKEDIKKTLKPKVEQFLTKVQDFLLLNAAVKNSLVFLSRHVANALYLQKSDRTLYINAVKILNALKNTRTTQDLDYLHNMHYLLHSDSKNKQTQLFVKTFNLHTAYLMQKLPPFIRVTQGVVNNDINTILHKQREAFNRVSLHDFKFFDRFAFVVIALLLAYFTIIVYLFVKYQKTNNSLQNSLIHDNLTGLYNRGSLLKDISVLQKSTIILLLNIDAFKEINDVYGNNFGNQVLVKFTEFLSQYLSKIREVKLYRVGGDEFAVLLTSKSVDEVMQIGKNLEEAIRDENFKIDNIRTNLSVRISVNSVPPLLENADLALKVIKKDTNRHIIEYKEKLSIKKKWQKNIEVINMVKSAISEDRMVPYFQGIVNLQTMKIEKYEALVRLILPSGEVLSPYAFLDTVRKTHYYYDITETMLRKTMKVAKIYPAQRFSINFSMKDITNKNIINTLFQLFDADKETAKRVDIELLETELVAVDDSRINNFITKVHLYGSKILIDDFGTGYSNFSYLSDLDVDIIKIDASITKEIISNPRKLHIAQTIHNFSSGMNMQNVAEFVETKEVALLLQKMGVEYAQGYLFSKPLPAPLENSDVSI